MPSTELSKIKQERDYYKAQVDVLQTTIERLAGRSVPGAEEPERGRTIRDRAAGIGRSVVAAARTPRHAGQS